MRDIKNFADFRNALNEDLETYKDEIQPFEVITNEDRIIILVDPSERARSMQWTFVHTYDSEGEEEFFQITFVLRNAQYAEPLIKTWDYHTMNGETREIIKYEEIYYEEICNDFLYFTNSVQKV